MRAEASSASQEELVLLIFDEARFTLTEEVGHLSVPIDSTGFVEVQPAEPE